MHWRARMTSLGRIPHASGLLVLLIMVIAGAPVFAVDRRGSEEPADDLLALRAPSAPRVRVEIMAGMWTPRAAGRIRLSADASDRIELGPDMGLDNKELTPNFEVRYRPDPNWELTAGAFRFSTSVFGDFNGNDATFGGVLLEQGEPFRSSLDIESVHLDLSWRRYRIHDRERDGGAADFSISPTVGVRWMGVRQEVERTGVGRASGSGDWGSVTVGAHLRLHWSPDRGLPVTRGIGIELGAGVGPAFGAGTGFTWHVRSGVRFEIFQNIDIMIAYRLLEADVRRGSSSEGYRFTAGLQGMFFLVGVRF